MEFRTITTKTNNFYKELVKISKGKIKNKLLAEGEDLIEESYKNNSLEMIIISKKDSKLIEKYKEVEFILLSEELFKTLSSYMSLPEGIGVCKLTLIDKDFGNKVLYLDNLQDAGNVGTLIRSALSFGYSSVILSPDCVSIFSRKVIQASKGAVFSIKIGVNDLLELKDDYHIYTTTLDGEDERKFDKLDDPFILVLGNEGHGVRKEYQDISTKLKIEMNGIDSLNVAIAGSIFMYRFH